MTKNIDIKVNKLLSIMVFYYLRTFLEPLNRSLLANFVFPILSEVTFNELEAMIG